MPTSEPSGRGMERPATHGRVTPSYRRGIETRRRIIEAAMVLFTERGFHGTPIKEVAELAGVSGPALYYHFRTKAEILAAGFFQLGDEFRAVERAAGRDVDDPVEALDAVIAAAAQHIWQHRQWFSLVWTEVRYLLPDDLEIALQRRRENYERWAGLIGRARPDLTRPQCQVLARSVMWMLLSAAFVQDFGSPVADRQALQTITHAASAAVRAYSPGDRA